MTIILIITIFVLIISLIILLYKNKKIQKEKILITNKYRSFIHDISTPLLVINNYIPSFSEKDEKKKTKHFNLILDSLNDLNNKVDKIRSK